MRPVYPNGDRIDGTSAAPMPAARRAVPTTLRVAAVIVAVEVVAEVVTVLRRDELLPGLRGFLVACLLLKVAFAVRALGLRAGPALGLLLLEGTTAVATLGAVDASTAARLALAACSVGVIALVFASLHAFPQPTLPRVDPPRTP